MCLCWEQLQEEFEVAATHEVGLPTSYHEECISEVNNLYVPVVPVADGSNDTHTKIPDSTCGNSPTWRAYDSENGLIDCCGSVTFNTVTEKCCDNITSYVHPITSSCGLCFTAYPCLVEGLDSYSAFKNVGIF